MLSLIHIFFQGGGWCGGVQAPFSHGGNSPQETLPVNSLRRDQPFQLARYRLTVWTSLAFGQLSRVQNNEFISAFLIRHHERNGLFLPENEQDGIRLCLSDPVSYTHLDVYKRQLLPPAFF